MYLFPVTQDQKSKCKGKMQHAKSKGKLKMEICQGELQLLTSQEK
jgi:hypothetical protein